MSIGDIQRLIHKDPLWNSPLKNDPDSVRVLNETLRDNRILFSLPEMMNLFRMVHRANEIEGAMAEVGVCNGGSAKLIARIKSESKPLFLFDNFDGFPEVTAGVDTIVLGDFKSSFDDVSRLLSPFQNVSIIKGFFPETTKQIPDQNMKFAFVHLDADTYKTTLEGLCYFYPRMSRGGYILMHDYNAESCPGVKKAVDEFLIDKPEGLIDLWNTQAAFVKI